MSRIEVMGDRANDHDGIGRLGKAIVDYNHGIKDLEIAAVSLPHDADLLAYCRKTNGTLTEALEYCSDLHRPLLFLSSGIELPDKPYNFPLVKIPNAALGVINYLSDVEQAATTTYSGWNVTITEHHQESKADTSGTAKKLADMLGISYDNIVKVRDFTKTQAMYPEVPDSSRDGYAIHSVVFTNPTTNEQSEPIEIVVQGREVYAQGVIDIYLAIKEHPEIFTDGTHDIVQLVKSGIVRVHDLAA